MSITLTINSFLAGFRTIEAKQITRNPFFMPLTDRASAELEVMRYGFPVLRDSSRHGLYALTYRCLTRRRIVHTLLRQNPDLTVDVLDDGERRLETYTTIYELLALVLWGDRGVRHAPANTGLMVALAPALVPVLPAAVGALVGQRPTGDDEDPTG